MKRLILGCAVIMALSPLPALAASNPIGGAVQNFIDTSPEQGVPDPRSYGGVDNCKAAPANAWWGRFAGSENVAPQGENSGGGNRLQTGEGCFPNRNSCLDWLRAMKTKYGFQPVYNQCREGYQPGASVPPWWSPESN